MNQEKESAFVFYDIPTEHSFPGGIAVDSKGNVWFSEYRGNKIAMLNKAGVIREYETPTKDSNPYDIAVDSKDNIWFIEQNCGSDREI